MTTVFALDRYDVADYVSVLFTVYTVLIIIRVLMSWFTRIPYNVWLMRVLDFVRETTDPYLNVFRRFVPMVRLGPGALDLSPIVALIVLFIVQAVVVRLIRGY
jgi:YggT family protein